MNFDYTLVPNFGLVVLNAIFFFPNGEFPIKNACNLFIDNAKTKIDDNFAKKIETDTLTKAISKLGFNADIFMGLFDDARYLAEVTEEFKLENTPAQPTTPASKVKPLASKDNLIQAKTGGYTIEQVKMKYQVTSEQEKEFLTL